MSRRTVAPAGRQDFPAELVYTEDLKLGGEAQSGPVNAVQAVGDHWEVVIAMVVMPAADFASIRAAR